MAFTLNCWNGSKNKTKPGHSGIISLSEFAYGGTYLNGQIRPEVNNIPLIV